ncbi:hypothetical protein CQT90_20525 [Salmonella enterica]|nr:hypothetical protein [Salmonella enterica]ECX8200780.1 hypothetical protein [Salmonella enterica]
MMTVLQSIPFCCMVRAIFRGTRLLFSIPVCSLSYMPSILPSPRAFLFMLLDKLIATLMKSKQENQLEEQLQQLGYIRVLILDKIGYM